LSSGRLIAPASATAGEEPTELDVRYRGGGTDTAGTTAEVDPILDLASSSALTDGFESGPTKTVWETIRGGEANAECGTNSGSKALKFGGEDHCHAATEPIPAGSDALVSFALKTGDPLDDPCETPEESYDEGVYLQYRTTATAEWRTIQYYPGGGGGGSDAGGTAGTVLRREPLVDVDARNVG
jgi:hypothetical protein